MKKIIATLPVILGFAAVASAQTSVVLDGTSGSNVLTNNYSTSGGLVLGQGFFADYLVIGGGGGGGGSGDDGTAFGGGGGGAGGMVFGGT